MEHFTDWIASLSREVTDKMRAANRTNARHSTGPRTAQGKHNSRRNALRHGIFANEASPWGEALDERASDYQRFCRRYAKALQPRDDFEALLVADMARTQWRLERLLQAEAAGWAWERAKLENGQRRKEAGEGVGLRVGLERTFAQEGGYAALPESEGKYELILYVLNVLVLEVDDHGYTEMGTQCLRALYGPRPAVAKDIFLINEYNSLKTRSQRERETPLYQHTRELFMKRLMEEISHFETLRDCLRKERTTLLDMERDSLLLGEKAAKILAGEETRLRNYLQQTFKQLMAWRQKSGQEEPSSAAGGKPSHRTGSPANGRPDAERRGGDGASARPHRLHQARRCKRIQPHRPLSSARPAPAPGNAVCASRRASAAGGSGEKNFRGRRRRSPASKRRQPPHPPRFAGHPILQRGESCNRVVFMAVCVGGARRLGRRRDAAMPLNHRWRAPQGKTLSFAGAKAASSPRTPSLAWGEQSGRASTVFCRSCSLKREKVRSFAGRPRLPERLRPGG